MILTEERVQQLVDYLGEDADRAEQIAQMSAEDAVNVINEDGYDFIADELKEFNEMMQKVSVAKTSSSGELSEDDLEQVAGGIAPFMVFQLIGAGWAVWQIIKKYGRW